MTVIFFSASQLTKQSCSKIMFDRMHDITPKVSEKMIEGEKWQASQTTSEYVEMAGTTVLSGIGFNFAIDEVCKTSRTNWLIEHKMVSEPPTDDWFFHSSIIQTAFYGALVRAGDGHLMTAEFLNDPAPKKIWVPWNKTKSRLNFGGDLYNVTCNDIAVLRFFITKARCIGNWDKVKRFDAAYKKKEWMAYFKDHVNFDRVR